MKTLAEIGNIKGNSTAETRWAKFGPYYAMFPIDFAFHTVDKYSKEGDFIIDPFAGRFSSIYAGAVLGRHSTGIEINPLGWLYGKTKLSPAPKDSVLQRLREVYEARILYFDSLNELGEFFTICYSRDVLLFLLAAKNMLDWKTNAVDSTLMAVLLVSLHGKLGEGLSNQLKQTKSMGVNYSIEWWRKNGYHTPPNIDVISFISEKIEWRYKKGIPYTEGKSQAILGDCTDELPKIIEKSKSENIKYSLLFTSPPYLAVVDYHVDQWLRLWLLGENNGVPKVSPSKHRGRFNSKNVYRELLDNVFKQCAELMADNATIVIRTDIRQFTYNLTKELLCKYYPAHRMDIKESFVLKTNQTELFNNKSQKKEVDIVLTRQ